MQVFCVQEAKSKQILESLKTWIELFGVPTRFFTDNGRQYMADNTTKFLKSNRIQHVTSPRYTPQANGLAETINKPIKNILRIYKGHSIEFITTRIHNFS